MSENMPRRERAIRETWEKHAKHFDFSKMPVWKAPYPHSISDRPTPMRIEDAPIVNDVLVFEHERHYSEDGRMVRDRIVCEGVVLDEHIRERNRP